MGGQASPEGRASGGALGRHFVSRQHRRRCLPAPDWTTHGRTTPSTQEDDGLRPGSATTGNHGARRQASSPRGQHTLHGGRLDVPRGLLACLTLTRSLGEARPVTRSLGFSHVSLISPQGA